VKVRRLERAVEVASPAEARGGRRRWRPKRFLLAMACLYLVGLGGYGEVQNLELARSASRLQAALEAKLRQNRALEKEIALLKENGVTAELVGVRLHLTRPGVVPVRVEPTGR
jgi:cell division protein FtsB